MSTRRTARVAEAIRQVVSSAILFELRDPRVKNVTILHVEVPTDLRTAKVYVSIMGDEKAERLSLQGLNSSRGWIQSKIADQLQLRYTPVITFVVDRGIKKSVEVSRLLHELQDAEGSATEDAVDDSTLPDEPDAPDSSSDASRAPD